MTRKLLYITLIAILSLTLFSCHDPKVNKIEHTNHLIFEGTLYETSVHLFKSNINGPKVAIIGGIHGDEIAGWHCATDLLERNDFKGEVLIIPKANILATVLDERYPGINNKGIYQGITYSDLNRSFPGKVDGTITEQLAYIIIQELTNFDPQYIIDLHESRDSYVSQKYIGDEVIYGNSKSSLLALDIVDAFNEKYLSEDDTPFIVDSNAPIGSLNNYSSKNFDAYVFTFETNRKLDLTKRIGQQKNLLDVFFNLIWN